MTPTQSYRTIYLTKGQQTVVDETDYDFLSQWKWFAQWDASGSKFYAQRTGKLSDGVLYRKGISMQRVLLGLGYGDKRIADHINRDSLNNCRHNLRIVSARESAWNRGIPSTNTSGYMGVWKEHGKWTSGLVLNRRTIRTGLFDNPLDAHVARKVLAKQVHGEFYGNYD